MFGECKSALQPFDTGVRCAKYECLYDFEVVTKNSLQRILTATEGSDGYKMLISRVVDAR